MAVTNRLSLRKLSSSKLTVGQIFTYAGVVDVIGRRGWGAYIDGLTEAYTGLACIYTNYESCGCWGDDGPPYYNCNSGDGYRSTFGAYVDTTTATPSSSFSNTATFGYKDAQNKGFKSFANSGYDGAYLSDNFQDQCNTNCSGYTQDNIISNGAFLGDNTYAAIKESDSSLWTWGYNAYGQLGNGTTTNRRSPVQVGSNSWKIVSGGGNFFGAIRSDDTLWMWGFNQYGQLGDNSSANKSSPIQVLGSWKFITCGSLSTWGIKSDDTLWAWGANANGQLGDGTTTQRNSPVQVSGGGTWKRVKTTGFFRAFGIKTNGTMFAWGNNTYGSLGDNSTISRSSPVQIGTAYSDWSDIQSYDYQYNSYGIRSNGELWGWGYQPYGITAAIRSSPAQVGSATNHAIGSLGSSIYYPFVGSNLGPLFITTNGNVIQYTNFTSTQTTRYSGGSATQLITEYNNSGVPNQQMHLIKYVP